MLTMPVQRENTKIAELDVFIDSASLRRVVGAAAMASVWEE